MSSRPESATSDANGDTFPVVPGAPLRFSMNVPLEANPIYQNCSFYGAPGSFRHSVYMLILCRSF